MSTAYTPGPWLIEDYGRSPVRIQAPAHDGAALALVYVTPHKSRKRTPELEGNARLVALAPDMLEALRGIIEYRRREYLDVTDTPAYAAAVSLLARFEQ